MFCAGKGGVSVLRSVVTSWRGLVSFKMRELCRLGASFLLVVVVCEDMELLRGRLRHGFVGCNGDASLLCSAKKSEPDVSFGDTPSLWLSGGLLVRLGILG